jgi:nucleotide sugar dehydrogenase
MTYENIEECQYICIAVPTELKGNNDINVEPLSDVYRNIKNIIKPNATIINESSVSIGMTRKIFGELNKKDINICFSPERIDSGRIEPKYEDIPKIVSGIDKRSLESIKKLYSTIFKNIVPVSSLEIAETCKLTENCFRMINIAYINEINDVCQKWNLNVHEVINACSTKPFGYMPFYPTLGVGGNCIPINPYWLKETNESEIPILMQSTKYMEGKPIREAEKLIQYCDENHKNNILIIGIGFKENDSSIYKSPCIEFANKLIEHKLNIFLYDPNVNQDELKNRGYQMVTKCDMLIENIEQNIHVVVINQCIDVKNIIIQLERRNKIRIIKYCDV